MITRAEKKTVLITGGSGQLGRALARQPWNDLEVVALDRQHLDITRLPAVLEAIASLRPAVIVNTAAWTAVDLAETEISEAFAANAMGPANLAQGARQNGSAMIHISTDCVFDGRKSKPYVEQDPVGPINVYGASKLAGELAVLRGQPRSLVIRTSWLLGDGPRNFLNVILDKAKRGTPLRVLGRDRGTPTGVRDLAAAIVVAAQRLSNDADAPTGLYHFAGTGQTTRYELAVEILSEAGRLTGTVAPKVRMASDIDDGQAAARPSNACLDSSAIARDYGIVLRHWRDMVADVVLDHVSRPLA